MRKSVIFAAALALAATAARAEDPAAPAEDEGAVANLIGNTLIIKNPKGVISTIVHYADHTFKGNVPEMSYAFKGVWYMKDGQLCRTYRPPIPNQPKTQCGPTLDKLPFGFAYTAPNGMVLVLRQGL